LYGASLHIFVHLHQRYLENLSVITVYMKINNIFKDNKLAFSNIEFNTMRYVYIYHFHHTY